VFSRKRYKVQPWLTHHRDSSFQTAWTWLQVGFLSFPLHGLTGALAVWGALISVWRCHYQTIVRWPVNWGFLLVAGLMVLSVPFSAYPGQALLGLPNFLPFFILFAGISAVIQTLPQLRQLAKLLLATMLPISLIGLGQIFLGWQGPDHPWRDFLGWSIAATPPPPTGRMDSIFMYPNSMAAYLIMLLPMAIALWLENLATFRLFHRSLPSWQQRQSDIATSDPTSLDLTASASTLSVPIVSDLTKADLAVPQGSAASKEASQPYSWWPLIYTTLVLGGMLLGIVFTASRSGWALTLFIGLAFGLYHGWRWLLALASAIAAAIAGAAYGPTPLQAPLRHLVPRLLWARLTDELYNLDRPVAELRQTQWEFVWNLIQQRPLFGWGLRNFTPLYEAHTGLWLGHPHNLFLMMAAETGLITALLLFGLVGWLLYRIVRLLQTLPQPNSSKGDADDRQILFAYWLGFLACTLFNLLDVTVMDFRINALGWFLLSALGGIARHQRGISPLEGQADSSLLPK